MNVAIEVTVAIFMIGIIFGAGRLTARVESLENWRNEVRNSLNILHQEINHVAELIRGNET